MTVDRRPPYLLVFLPVVLLCLLFMGVWAGNLHLKLADFLFLMEGGHWALKKHWFAQEILHNKIKLLHALIVISFVCYTFYHKIRLPHSPINRANFYVLASLLLSYVLITVIKHLIHMDCPWDLRRYGGFYPYIDFLQERLPKMKRGLCFPAAHASLGYSWLALYFYFREIRPQWRGLGIIVPVLVGLLLGLVQQLRGAHFILDDIATLAICWLSAGVLYLIFLSPSLRQKSVPL